MSNPICITYATLNYIELALYLSWFSDSCLVKRFGVQPDTNGQSSQKLCEVIMSSANTRLTESGFWRAFEGAKTELKFVWRLLRGDNLQGNKKPKVSQPSRPKNRSKDSDQGAVKTPESPMGQLDFQCIDQGIDDYKPWSTMRTGRSDDTVMNFT